MNDIENILSRPITAKMMVLLFAMLLAHELLSDLSHYRTTQVNASMMQPSVMDASPGIVRNQSLIQKSIRVSLFGDYIPNALGDLNVKPSGLDLSLVGILFSPIPQASQAIIGVARGSTNVFSVGDSLPGGVKIKQITPDGVVLEHDGELESLSLPKNELSFDPLPKPLED